MEARVMTFMFLSGSGRDLRGKREDGGSCWQMRSVWVAEALGLVLQPGTAGYLPTR